MTTKVVGFPPGGRIHRGRSLKKYTVSEVNERMIEARGQGYTSLADYLERALRLQSEGYCELNAVTLISLIKAN